MGMLDYVLGCRNVIFSGEKVEPCVCDLKKYVNKNFMYLGNLLHVDVKSGAYFRH
jgi:hypothetical protein